MAVLRLYSKVPIKVWTPHRRNVAAIVSALDLDRSPKWTLGTEEFAHVMAVLSAQLFLRLVITLIFLIACPILGGVLWTLFIDFITDEDGVPRSGLRTGLPHWIRCSSSVFEQLHLGPPLLTVTLMMPLTSIVHLVELQLYKVLHLRCWCWGNARNDLRSESFSDLHNELGVTDLITLQRKSQIVTEITRRASMVNETPLLERMSRGL